jgi:cysteine-rich repeat protein
MSLAAGRLAITASQQIVTPKFVVWTKPNSGEPTQATASCLRFDSVACVPTADGLNSQQQFCVDVRDSLCTEVVTEVGFCSEDEQQLRSGRQVCVFSGCKTPADWTTQRGFQITTTSWCRGATEQPAAAPEQTPATNPAQRQLLAAKSMMLERDWEHQAEHAVEVSELEASAGTNSSTPANSTAQDQAKWDQTADQAIEAEEKAEENTLQDHALEDTDADDNRMARRAKLAQMVEDAEKDPSKAKEARQKAAAMSEDPVAMLKRAGHDQWVKRAADEVLARGGNVPLHQPSLNKKEYGTHSLLAHANAVLAAAEDHDTRMMRQRVALAPWKLLTDLKTKIDQQNRDTEANNAKRTKKLNAAKKETKQKKKDSEDAKAELKQKIQWVHVQVAADAHKAKELDKFSKEKRQKAVAHKAKERKTKHGRAQTRIEDKLELEQLRKALQAKQEAVTEMRQRAARQQKEQTQFHMRVEQQAEDASQAATDLETELDDEKSKVQLLEVKALNAKREAKEDAEAEAEAERKRVAAMSAEEFKEHQLQLHTKAEAAKELARNLESALEPLQHAESKQYREFRAKEADLLQRLNESRAEFREVQNQTVTKERENEKVLEASKAAAEVRMRKEELEVAAEHDAAVQLAQEKAQVYASRIEDAQSKQDQFQQKMKTASEELKRAKDSLLTEQHVARKITELAGKATEELMRILQDEKLHTKQAQNLHNATVARFQATLEASAELSSVAQKDTAKTNQSLKEALAESARLKETNVDLRDQLAAIQPVDCVLSEWSEWSDCDAKCGPGDQHRSRKVLRPAKNGGECSNMRTQQQKCVLEQCPICGDGVLNTQEEQCDSVEGCTADCVAEDGWSCAGNSCGKCGNGLVEAAEACDDGEISSGDGCGVDCQIEEGFVCVQQADHTNCTQIEKFTETITSGISTGQTSCGDSAPVFFPTDATDGTGYCMAVPDDIGHKVFSTTVVSGGDALGLAPSTNGEYVLVKSSRIPGLVAAPGLERSTSHQAMCRTTAAGVCTSGAQQTRQCVRYATAECLELVMDERFCDSTREIPGEVQMRARKDEGLLHRATPVCVFEKCQLPETWLTTEGVMARSIEWCANAVLQGI